jgi:hypothetical protein
MSPGEMANRADRGAIMLVGTRDAAMDNSQRARLLLQELWRQRLEFARQQFEAAKARVEGAKEFQLQVQSADGADAFRRALQAERRALVKYRRALRTFTDLVVEGRFPKSVEGKPPS